MFDGSYCGLAFSWPTFTCLFKHQPRHYAHAMPLFTHSTTLTTIAGCVRVPLISRTQATDVLRGSGSLSGERKEYLDNLAKQLGLPDDERDKTIREVRRCGVCMLG